MRVLVTGASGLVGSALCAALGQDAVPLHRGASWDPARGVLDPRVLDGIDAIVHLGGESIASGRWTPEVKRRIRESRVRGTELLAAAAGGLRVLVSASAVGWYGDRGDEVLDEDSAPGRGFLADVCRAWEAAAERAAAAGVRVVTPRQGIVLSAAGGALAQQLPAFRSGLGVRLGDGSQWWSWIALDDVLAGFEWLLHDDDLAGPVNFTAPEPVTNLEFVKTLGQVLHRPAVLFAPERVVKTMLGGMAREMLLASQRAVPMKLNLRGFPFAFPELDQALRNELGRF